MKEKLTYDDEVVAQDVSDTLEELAGTLRSIGFEGRVASHLVTPVEQLKSAAMKLQAILD